MAAAREQTELVEYATGSQEPISLDLAKLQVKLSPSEAWPEDDLIASVYIPTARQRCERFTGFQLRRGTFDFKASSWPCDGFIELPRAPLVSVTHVKYLDTSGVLQTLTVGTDYVVSAYGGEQPRRGRVSLVSGQSWPSLYDHPDAVQIRFVCGFASADVPGLLKAGMLMDLATLFAHRESVVTGVSVADIPDNAKAIYGQFKSHATQLLRAS